ncbi:MAG: hypothetical protein E7381_00335 [Clostridiales bacterium]|nr:hypothetical protein [Clostridiales bacterium]
MKKYLSWIVCAVLVVGSVFLSKKQTFSIAGAGNGVAEEFTTIEELGEVLAWMSEKSGNETEPVVYTESGNALAETTVKDYTSGSFRISTSFGMSQEVNFNGQEQRVGASMEREMTCYFTETASYYEVDAYIQTKSEQGEGGMYTNRATSHSTIRIKEKLYVDDTHFLVYIEEYTIAIRAKDAEGNSIDQEEINFEPIKHKWIDFSEYEDASMLELMHTVNGANFGIMTTIGSYMLQNEDEKMFYRSGDTYTLRESHGEGLVALFLGVEDVDADIPKDASLSVDFTVNLSAPKNPFISLYFDMSGEYRETIPTGVDTKSEYNSKVEAVELMQCEIFEINNTVVNMPTGTFYNPEDFDIV